MVTAFISSVNSNAIFSEFIPLNAIILREALLADPEKTKQFLGLEIKDALKPKPVKKEEKKK